MRDRISTFLVVTLVTLTIWLFAEAESLGHAAPEARVELVSPDSSRMIRPSTGWDGRVTIDLSGSKTAIERAREVLDQPVRLTLSSSIGEGEQSLDLLEMLMQCEPLRRTGVSVESVRPLRAAVTVQEIITRSIPITAELNGLQVAGDAIVTPAAAEVRMPRALLSRLGETSRCIARPTREQLQKVQETGPALLSVDVVLPEVLRGEKGVELATAKAQISFSVKSTMASSSFTFPVQVLTLPVEWSDWNVQINDADQILTVQLIGPADVIEKLKSPEERLIAVLALSSDDLAKKLTSKEVGFGVIRGGVMSPLPPGVEVKADKKLVRFTVKKRGEP